MLLMVTLYVSTSNMTYLSEEHTWRNDDYIQQSVFECSIAAVVWQKFQDSMFLCIAW